MRILSSILAVILFTNLRLCAAAISGYESAGAGAAGAPAAEPATSNCGNLDETSEAKANGPNPFCVYPALVGDHPSPGRRPGETHATEFSGNAFGEDHGAGEPPAGGFTGPAEPGVGPFLPGGRRKRRMTAL